MGSRLDSVVVCVALLAGVAAAPASAAFPGANGKIAYSSAEDGDSEVFVMNQDGSVPVQLTHNASADGAPAWSPDGKMIAFASDRDETDPECDINGDFVCNTEIYVMNADGTGQSRLTTNPVVDHVPTWTPDGARITFQRTTGCFPDGCETFLRNVQADGSGESFQAGAGPGVPSAPGWAPNGQRIMNLSYEYSSPGGALYTANPNGTGAAFFCCTPLAPPNFGDNPPPTAPDWSPDGSAVAFSWKGVSVQSVSGGSYTTLASGRDPAWSPDATKIAFFQNGPSGNGIYVMASDGTNQSFLRPGSAPSWQPIPVNGYPRPLSASPVKVTLALAYERCTSPNRTHGPPLEHPSCAPPVPSSSQLTVGTFDANGQSPGGAAQVVLTPLPGDPGSSVDEADVHLRAKATDVRLASDLSDYVGSIEARMSLRITDKDNTPHAGGPGAATVKDVPYTFAVPCNPTPDAPAGSSCYLDTTAEALVPGLVKERLRAVWEVGQVALHDGAGDAFMRQGIFVP